MLCRATQDGWVMVESSDKMWSTGEGNGKPLQYSCLENPMNSMKRQNDRILKEELPRSVGAQYATGDQWRNNSRKNEETEPKQKQHPVVDVTGDGSKVHSLPLLQKRKTIFLNIPNKAPVFITHNLYQIFQKYCCFYLMNISRI